MCSFVADREDDRAWRLSLTYKQYPKMSDEQLVALVAEFTKETTMSVVRIIDLKYHIDEKGQLVKTGNGVPIPENEPTMLFRARDRLALPMLLAYRRLCVEDGCNDFQLGSLDELIARFKAFSIEHSEVMKQPGITRGL